MVKRSEGSRKTAAAAVRQPAAAAAAAGVSQAAAGAAAELPAADAAASATPSYIASEHRWTNRQRTLVLGSRGISHRHRHLLKDVQGMLPHSKSEAKFEKSGSLSDITEIAELRSCNNVLYFECRKHTLLYLHMSCPPFGPTLKFQVLNVHTLGELRLTGNSLKASRPLLNFDEAFESTAELRLMKTALHRAFGVPRNHPKSQPFFDRVFSFFVVDGKVWFRAYQISPSTPDSADPEHQVLTEIGPRFVLEPILIQDGAFGGPLIYKNLQFEAPAEILRKQRQAKLAKSVDKAGDKHKAAKRKVDAQLNSDDSEDFYD